MSCNDDEELFKKIHANLKSGQEIKNYKELCKTLDMKEKGGNQRKLQLHNLTRFFEYEKDGQKYMIKSIYDIPKPKNDNRKNGNHSIYIDLIEAILLDSFAKNEGRVLYFRNKQLWDRLGMINKYYQNKKITCRELQMLDQRITDWELENFYERSYSIMSEIVKRALMNLQDKRKLIFVEEQIIAVDADGDHNLVDDETEKEMILDCGQEALRELQCRDIQDIFKNPSPKVTYKRFVEIRNRKLHGLYGWQYIYARYKIICSDKKYLESAAERSINNIRKQLNIKVIDRVNNDAGRIGAKLEEKYGDTYYVAIQEMLSDKLLNLDSTLEQDIFDALSAIENKYFIAG